MKEKWEHKTPGTTSQVVIAWRDIQELSAWNDDNDIIGPVHLETIGWLLYEGPDAAEPGADIVVIAKTYDYNDRRWADYTVFPRTVLKKVYRHETTL